MALISALVQPGCLGPRSPVPDLRAVARLCDRSEQVFPMVGEVVPLLFVESTNVSMVV